MKASLVSGDNSSSEEPLVQRKGRSRGAAVWVKVSMKEKPPRAKAVPWLKMEPAGKVIGCSDLRTNRRIRKNGCVDGRSNWAEVADMDSETSGGEDVVVDVDDAIAYKGKGY